MAESWNTLRVHDFLEDLGLNIIKEDHDREIIVASDEANSIVNMVFACSGEVLVMEQIVSLVPDQDGDAFARRALQMNREIYFGAFAMDNQSRVLIYRAAHPFERLTKHMIEASLRGLERAMGLFGQELASFHQKRP